MKRSAPGKAWLALCVCGVTSLPCLNVRIGASEEPEQHPPSVLERAALDRLIKALQADEFATREEAMEKLKELGAQAEPFLREARKRCESPELLNRLNMLLAPVDPGGILWTFPAPETQPVVQDGRLWTKRGDHLVCLDAATGKPLWEVPLKAYSNPVVRGKRIFLARDPGGPERSCEFVALDVETGKTLWTRTMEGGNIFVTPLASSDKIVVMPLSYKRGYATQVVCLNQADGASVWEKSLPRELAQAQNSALVGNTLLISAKKGPDLRTVHELPDPDLSAPICILHAWNVDTGLPLWKTVVEEGCNAPNPLQVAAVEGFAVVTGEKGTYGYSLTDGKRLWESEPCWKVVLDSRCAYLLGPQDRCLNLRDGKVVWSNQVSSYTWDASSEPCLSNNRIMRVALHEVSSLDTATGQVLWKNSVPDHASYHSRIAVADGRLYVILESNTGKKKTLYCLRAEPLEARNEPVTRGGSGHTSAVEKE